MTPPRVLLVDDDAAIRRFVALALEDEPLELLTVGSAEDALVVLRTGPVQLVLTDLMLPGASGADLLQTLRSTPGLGPVAHVAVLSAGLDSATRQRLQTLGAWRLLHKPVALAELQGCVQEALALHGSPMAAPAPVPAPTPPDGDDRLTNEERAAIAQHFGGNGTLFLAFRDSCQQLFTHDLLEGQRACDALDLPAMHRLAHSLKSVLASLGHAQASAQARQLENACAQAAEPADIAVLWVGLHAALTPLARPPSADK